MKLRHCIVLSIVLFTIIKVTEQQVIQQQVSTINPIAFLLTTTISLGTVDGYGYYMHRWHGWRNIYRYRPVSFYRTYRRVHVPSKYWYHSKPCKPTQEMNCTACNDQVAALDTEWQRCLTFDNIPDCNAEPFCKTPPENMPCILDFEAYNNMQIALFNSQNALVNSMGRYNAHINQR